MSRKRKRVSEPAAPTLGSLLSEYFYPDLQRLITAYLSPWSQGVFERLVTWPQLDGSANSVTWPERDATFCVQSHSQEEGSDDWDNWNNGWDVPCAVLTYSLTLGSQTVELFAGEQCFDATTETPQATTNTELGMTLDYLVVHMCIQDRPVVAIWRATLGAKDKMVYVFQEPTIAHIPTMLRFSLECNWPEGDWREKSRFLAQNDEYALVACPMSVRPDWVRVPNLVAVVLSAKRNIVYWVIPAAGCRFSEYPHARTSVDDCLNHATAALHAAENGPNTLLWFTWDE